MPELFGLDIAGLVASNIEAAGNLRAGVLTQGRGLGTSHTFQGFLEVKETRLPDSLVVTARPVLTILGASVAPPVVPEVNDQVTLDGPTYELIRLVARDPAAAVYEFEVA